MIDPVASHRAMGDAVRGSRFGDSASDPDAAPLEAEGASPELPFVAGMGGL